MNSPRDTSPSSPLQPARGSVENLPNRFEKLSVELDPEAFLDDEGNPLPPVRTQFLRDDTQTIIARNNSPDVGFDASINVYRGCEHGCAYCFARPTHEYLGMSAGLDFESKILVKERAPELLRAELSKKSWKPQVLAMSGVTDCFQPVERRLELTRRCLGVLAEFRNPVVLITKNHLITRDIDHLAELGRFQAVAAAVSITSLDGDLAKILEPRASTPNRRLDAIRQLSAAGIPARVMVAPVIPGLNDHEIPQIIEAAAEAGATSASYVMLRLPWTVAPVFEAWLDRHVPGHKEKILGRVRDMRGGKLYDSAWRKRQTGEGFWAEQIRTIFQVAMRKAGLRQESQPLSTASFRVPTAQLSLFE